MKKNKMQFRIAFQSSYDGSWVVVVASHNLAWAEFIVNLVQKNPGWKYLKLAIFEKGNKKPIQVYEPKESEDAVH